MKKGCLFDLDGTLVDSLEDLALSTNAMLEMHHLPRHDISAYNHFVGNGVRKLVERAIGSEHSDILEECLQDFYKIYDEHCLDYTKPYSGMKELITQLHRDGMKLGVITNKPHHLAIRIVEQCFPGMFTVILGQQDIYPTKPHPESTCIALLNMKLSRQDCYFVGDSDVDIETGDSLDMETIGVTWGFRGRNELEDAGATHVVETPSQILEIIYHDRS